jgi:prepilin-type N-terminal cleavage/methylation domain-containing protein
MRARRRRRGQRGFTMIELLVTMSIAVIGLLAIMSMFVVTSRANASGAASGEGVSVASATVEEIRSMPLDDMFATYGPMPIDVALDTVAGRAGTTFTRRVQVSELTATSTNLIKIRVEVGWTDAGAAPGAEGGIHDHRISFELIRTASEAL